MSLVFPPSILVSSPFIFLRLTSPGQQADKADAGGGAASEERAGEDRQASPEEHERPDLGRDEPLIAEVTDF